MNQQTGIEASPAKSGILGQVGEMQLARAPFLAMEKGQGGYVVNAPELQKTVALDYEDWAFLGHFTGLQTAQDVAVQLQSCAEIGGKYQSEMDIYLGLQRFCAMGLLVDTRLLSVSDLGGLVGFDLIMPADIRAGHSLVAITKRGDGRWVVVHGHGDVSAALAGQSPLRAHILSPVAALAQLASLPEEFFGSARGGIPYQSIFYQGKELVHGRRPDLYERFAKMDMADLVDKRVLDLGCNIGMNCILAAQYGARGVLGLDLAPFAAAGRRLNLFFDASCRFEAQDLNVAPREIDAFDTVFLFAVLGHLKTFDGVISILKSSGAKTVYVEAHCDIQDRGQTQAFLNLPLFEDITPLGLNFDNTVRKTQSRQFYKCRMRP